MSSVAREGIWSVMEGAEYKKARLRKVVRELMAEDRRA
jgi:hypothetical protein